MAKLGKLQRRQCLGTGGSKMIKQVGEPKWYNTYKNGTISQNYSVLLVIHRFACRLGDMGLNYYVVCEARGAWHYAPLETYCVILQARI